ncbi:MAG TPA: hypothetical protein VFQ39_13890, partial [Longimicrobium sp.]|nr:hypothetical protein [Longimicrobium sp.]
EKRLRLVIAQAGVAKAFEALEVIASPAGDAALISEAHGLAHGLGIAAYPGPEKMADVFAQCPFTQISGCHHGVIQGYFLDLQARGVKVGTAELDAVCAPHVGTGARFGQCSHGLGHGVMAFANHRLPQALELCDRVSDGYVRETCYGGAFMENIVGATHPEHTAESHSALGHGASAEHGEHAEHGEEHAEHGEEHAEHGGGEHAGHEGMAEDHSAHGDAHAGHEETAEPWVPVKREDPLYPCDVVAERYWEQCYLIQTASILYFNGGNMSKTAEACRQAPTSMVDVCYRSLGRDITSFASRDAGRTKALCASAGEASFEQCIAGAALSLFDVRAEPADGMALCRLVEGDVKKRCYFVVGGSTRHLPSEAARVTACAASEDGFVAECRRGAGLPATEQAASR